MKAMQRSNASCERAHACDRCEMRRRKCRASATTTKAMPYISSSGQVYTIDGPRQRRVQLEKPILLAVAMLLCVFVLARQGTAALASAVHVNRGVPAAQLAQDARLDSERRRIVESSEANATGAT